MARKTYDDVVTARNDLIRQARIPSPAALAGVSAPEAEEPVPNNMRAPPRGLAAAARHQGEFSSIGRPARPHARGHQLDRVAEPLILLAGVQGAYARACLAKGGPCPAPSLMRPHHRIVHPAVVIGRVVHDKAARNERRGANCLLHDVDPL